MSRYINLCLHGTVYFVSRRYGEDEKMLRLFTSKLKDTDKESTFDIIYSQLPGKWHQQDDVIYPFEVKARLHVQTVWTFDLDNDFLRLDKKDRRTYIPLSLLRQRSVTVSDFELYEPPQAPKLGFPPVEKLPRRDMRRTGICREHLERHTRFIGRLLADFAVQWRHIIRGRYNSSTFRKLACAIIRIVTLDFNVHELTTPGPGKGGFLVWLHNLPDWPPFAENIVRVGGVSIVISQHPRHAITLIRDDFQAYVRSRAKHGLTTANDTARTYLILSVKEILLYRMDSNSERCTGSERLFDGDLPPSEEAVSCLVEATLCEAPPSPLHQLPLELQSLILNSVSAGPIEKARVACVLHLGEAFTWEAGGRSIERQRLDRFRVSDTPVESRIFFGQTFSGIAYK